MKRGIRIYPRKGVPNLVTDFVVNICEWFETVSDVEHLLPVKIVPNVEVTTGQGVRASFGLFQAFHRWNVAEIYIGGGTFEFLLDAGISRQEAYYNVGWVTLHELVHYEQFRDCRPLQERGVNLRAKNLYRRFRDYCLLTDQSVSYSM